MKKQTLMGMVVLALGLLLAGQVCAAEITIFDKNVDNTVNTWYNRGNSPGEDQEVEVSAVTGQLWDLEGMKKVGNILSIYGGFNFSGGGVGAPSVDPNNPQFINTLFISTTKPLYGKPDLVGIGDSKNLVKASYFPYNYAIVFDYANLKYDVFQAKTDDSSLVILNGPSGGTTMESSNPWTIYDQHANGQDERGTWNRILQNQVFVYNTGLTDAQTGYLGDAEVGGASHNEITNIDLSFLGNYENNFWAHMTMECGNDNLMANVPLPGAVLLLGAGMVRLVAYARRRQED